MNQIIKRILIDNPLWEFMHNCEVYCSAACCELDAFEIHKALLIRKEIDLNYIGEKGTEKLRLAQVQLENHIQELHSESLRTEYSTINFWTPYTADLPEFSLPKDKISEWIEKWRIAFEGACTHSNGIQQNH